MNIRQKAEELLNTPDSDLDNVITDQENLSELLHELRVHQIELELQNEELKNTQQELEKSRDRYSELYDFAPMGYFTFDTHGMILEVNLTGASQLGIARTLLIRKPFIAYLLRESHQAFYDHIKQLILEPSRQSCELKIKKKEDGFFYAMMESTGIPNEECAINQFRAAVMDVTHQKQTEQRLQMALEAKTQFLANMSHELRTPLHGIMGVSEVLRQSGDTPDEEQASYLQMIHDSGQHLLSLINDLFEVSQIEFEQIQLTMTPVSIKKQSEASLRFLKQAIYDKKLTVSSRFDSAVTMILADERRLKKILVNLLSNAIKFTPKGGSIGLEVCGDATRGMVDLTVWDTGIGIAKEEIEKLFEPFVQLSSGLTKKYQGTGLGLFLVSRLAELHGGSVSVTTEIGQGSRFTVSLPWRRADGLVSPIDEDRVLMDCLELETAMMSVLQPVIVLLAENDSTNQQLLSDCLNSPHYHVILATNEIEALEKARKERPNVILINTLLSDCTGLEMIYKIRIDAGIANIPIIALSSVDNPSDKKRYLDAGANDYLCKPITCRGLILAIEVQLQK
jgi:PAS domain S-box-containing protein